MKKLSLFLLLLLPLMLLAQRRPDQFTEEASPNNENFEVYSQKNGVNRKASLAALRRYFGANIVSQIYPPPLSNNLESTRNKIVDVSSDGSVWYIDWAGYAIRLNSGVPSITELATLSDTTNITDPVIGDFALAGNTLLIRSTNSWVPFTGGDGLYGRSDTIPDGTVAVVEGEFTLQGESVLSLLYDVATLKGGTHGMQATTGGVITGDLQGPGARYEVESDLVSAQPAFEVRSRDGNDVGFRADSLGVTLPNELNAPSLITDGAGRIGIGPAIPTTAADLLTVDIGDVFVGANNVEANLQETGANILALDALLGGHLAADADLDSLNEIQTAAEVAAVPFGGVTATNVQGQLEQLGLSTSYGNVAFVSPVSQSVGLVGDFSAPFSADSIEQLSDTITRFFLAGDYSLGNGTGKLLPVSVTGNGVLRLPPLTSYKYVMSADSTIYTFRAKEIISEDNSRLITFGDQRSKLNLTVDRIYSNGNTSFLIDHSGGTLNIGEMHARNCNSNLIWCNADSNDVVRYNIGTLISENNWGVFPIGTIRGSSVTRDNVTYNVNIDNIVARGAANVLFRSAFGSARFSNSLIFLNVNNLNEKSDAYVSWTDCDYCEPDTSNPLSSPFYSMLGASSVGDNTTYRFDIQNARIDRFLIIETFGMKGSNATLNLGTVVSPNVRTVTAIYRGTRADSISRNRVYISAKNAIGQNKALINLVVGSGTNHLPENQYTEITGRWEVSNDVVIRSSVDFYLLDANLTAHPDSAVVQSDRPINLYVRNTNVTQADVGPNVTVVSLEPNWQSETFTATASQTDFVVSAGTLPSDGANVRVYNDSGAKLRETDHYTYVAATGTVTLVTPASAGEKYTIEYYQ